jgi:hypothetical protein
MTRFTRYAVAAFLSLAVSSPALARTGNGVAAPVGARNSASDTDVLKQCNEEAMRHWGTNSQDMQTPRDYLYRACAFDHGMRNP